MQPAKTHPLVSVCIPSYNYARFIGRCVESLLFQTFDSFEIVISDDGSSDDSDRVIQSYHDRRIRFVKQPIRLGMWGNFKACLSLSQAPYALFLSADDYVKPHMLEKCVSVLEANPRTAFCHTGVELFDDSGKILGATGAFTRSFVCDGKSTLEDFLYGKRVVLSSSIFRRRCFDEADGWSIDYRICFDAELWFRMLLRWEVGYVGELLAGFRVHPISDSWRLLQVQEDMKFIGSLFDRLPESHHFLNQYRTAVLALERDRALGILSIVSASPERDFLLKELFPGTRADFQQKLSGNRKKLTPKMMTALRPALLKLPAPLRHQLGILADFWRRRKVHRLAKEMSPGPK